MGQTVRQAHDEAEPVHQPVQLVTRRRALLLHRHHAGTGIGDSYRLVVRPVRQLSEAPGPGTTETLVVLDGRLLAVPTAHPVELGPGQGLTFAADVPHAYEGLGGSASCLLVLTFLA